MIVINFVIYYLLSVINFVDKFHEFALRITNKCINNE